MRFLIYILSFLYIYNPQIIILPLNAGVLFGAFCMLYYIGAYISRPKSLKIRIFKRKLIIPILFSIVLVIYALLIAFLSGSRDFQLAKTYLSFILFYFPGAVFLGNYLTNRYDFSKILWFLVNIAVIQGVIILLMLLIPSFRDLLFSLLKDGDIRQLKNELSGGYRFLGFSYGTTWDLAFVQSLFLVFFAINIRTMDGKIRYHHILKYLVILVSVLLSGRTGFVGIIISFVIFLIPQKMYQFSLKKTFIFVIKMVGTLCIVFFISSSFLSPKVRVMLEKDFIPWAFEMFEKRNQGFETESSNELKNMYFSIPTQTLIFGDGFYVNPDDPNRYYMDTDAGYMRQILFYGLIGTFFLCLFYISIFYGLYKSVELSEYRSFLSIGLFMIMIYYFIGQIKGDLLSGADMPIKTLFLIYIIFTNIKLLTENKIYGNN